MLTTTVAGRMSRSPTFTPYWKTLMTWSGSASASKSVIAASWIVGSKGTPTSSIFSAPSSLKASSKAAATGPVWKSNLRRVHTPARRRGGAGSSVHPTHWLISTQDGTRVPVYNFLDALARISSSLLRHAGPIEVVDRP